MGLLLEQPRGPVLLSAPPCSEGGVRNNMIQLRKQNTKYVLYQSTFAPCSFDFVRHTHPAHYPLHTYKDGGVLRGEGGGLHTHSIFHRCPVKYVNKLQCHAKYYIQAGIT